jgi:hypothetical protein
LEERRGEEGESPEGEGERGRWEPMREGEGGAAEEEEEEEEEEEREGDGMEDRELLGVWPATRWALSSVPRRCECGESPMEAKWRPLPPLFHGETSRVWVSSLPPFISTATASLPSVPFRSSVSSLRISSGEGTKRPGEKEEEEGSTGEPKEGGNDEEGEEEEEESEGEWVREGSLSFSLEIIRLTEGKLGMKTGSVFSKTNPEDGGEDCVSPPFRSPSSSSTSPL